MLIAMLFAGGVDPEKAVAELYIFKWLAQTHGTV